MRIVVIGGSGFIGRLLVRRLESDGHSVSVLSSRNLKANELAPLIEGADTVINVAGADAGAKRWTSRYKHELVASRVLTTRAIVDAIALVSKPPALVNMSAVGYYGNTTVPSNEAMGAGQTFMAQLCVAWEKEAQRAEQYTRVVRLRMAVLLDPKAGALAKLILPFKLFVGGPLGWGSQYMAWVHRDDAIEAIAWAATSPSASGPYNVAAPEAVTMRQFTRALGKALHRPSLFYVPPMLLRILIGDMADAVLHGQNVDPMRLYGTTFTFKFPTLEGALHDLL